MGKKISPFYFALPYWWGRAVSHVGWLYLLFCGFGHLRN